MIGKNAEKETTSVWKIGGAGTMHKVREGKTGISEKDHSERGRGIQSGERLPSSSKKTLGRKLAGSFHAKKV